MQLANKPTTFLSRLTRFCSNLSALILMGMLLLASAPAAAAPSPTPAAGVVCNPGSATRANAYGGYINKNNLGAKETPRGTTCVACDAGHASADGKDCLPCALGMLGNTGGNNRGATTCVYPGPGRVTERPGPKVSLSTVACQAGLFNPGNRLVTDYRACEQCPVNTYSSAGAGQCTPCPPGKSTKGTKMNTYCR